MSLLTHSPDPAVKQYVGVKAVMVVDGLLLVLERKSSQGLIFWDLPGGRMQPGETTAEALTRELDEEIPNHPQYTIGTLLEAHKKPEPLDDGTELLLLYYQVKTPVFEPQLSQEHLSYVWMPPADLAQLPATHRERYLRLYQRCLEHDLASETTSFAASV